MSEDFEDTITCPFCEDENAYFDGFSYRCSSCEREWSEDELTGDNEVISQQEKALVGNSITLQSLQSLFSPAWKYHKFRNLYKEHGIIEDYQNELEDILENTHSYDAVLAIKKPIEISEKQQGDIVQRVVRNFLESRDELPVIPTLKDWTAYLGAPNELISEILPKEEFFFRQFLPLETDYDDLTILFHNAIKAVYETVVKKDEYLGDELSLKILEQSFTELVVDDKSLDIENSETLAMSIVKEYLNNELNRVKLYKNFMKDKEGIRSFIADSSSRHMTLAETIVEMLKPHFL